MNKKLLMFGIPIFALVLVSAAVLSYFGLFSLNLTVDPAIKVDGQIAPVFDHEIPEEAPGGEVFCFLHKVENKASIPMSLELEILGSHNGVDIAMYNVPETTTLEFCEKDGDWKCLTSGATATLTFDTVNPRFVGTLTTTGLADEGYALIYYPDQEDRFDPLNWNGDGGQVIHTWTGNYDGAIDTDLGRNLPHSDDWNINPSPNYCNLANGFDDYEHCRGAKLWIVKTSDLTDGDKLPLVNWNPTGWLFETDLITYSDCDFYTDYVVDFTVDREGPINFLATQSHTMTPMLICYDFNEMVTGTFDVDTKLVPKSE